MGPRCVDLDTQSLVIEGREVSCVAVRVAGRASSSTLAMSARALTSASIVSPAARQIFLDVRVHPLPHPDSCVPGVVARVVAHSVVPLDDLQEVLLAGRTRSWLAAVLC